MKDIKVGDIVHVRCTVQDVIGDGFRADAFNPLSGERHHYSIKNTAIVHVEPRQIKVGDRVRTPGGIPGTLVATNEGDAWVRVDPACAHGFPHSTYRLSELTRIEGEPS